MPRPITLAYIQGMYRVQSQGFALLSQFPFPALKLLLPLERRLRDFNLTFFRSDHRLIGREGFDRLERADFVDTHLVFINEPPKASPVKAPQQVKRPPSTSDTPKPQNAAEKRPEELSRIQQGVRQVDPALADQQRALRGKVYGAQNGDVAFRKAGKAIAP